MLVVDDEAELREILRRILTRSGFEVTCAEDGPKALELVKAGLPDLVLLDVMMPGMSGYDVLTELRKTHGHELPVIMNTALGAGPDVVKAMRMGANDYITKPFAMAEVLERVNKALAPEIGVGVDVSGFVLESVLGKGGSGTVFQAREQVTGRQVAIKVLERNLTSDADFANRFIREARLAETLTHPNIVRVFSSGVFRGQTFMVMELVRGMDLFDRTRKKPLTIGQALRVASQVGAGLVGLHQVGISHRDIKPENILLDHEDVAKITDFGLARDLWSQERLTQQGVTVGTLAYMSPDQLMGRPDDKADMYSLGCTLFFMLAQDAPFSPKDTAKEVIHKKFYSPPNIQNHNAQVPGSLAALVTRLMAPDPANRPDSYEVMQSQILKLCDAIPA